MTKPPTGKSTIRLLRSTQLRRRQKKQALFVPSFPCRKQSWGWGWGGSKKKERNNLLTWLINPAITKQLSAFITGTQTRSRPALLAGLHGTIRSRVGDVLSFLSLCSNKTPTRQRLILTRSSGNLDLFRHFGGGEPSGRLRTNLSFVVYFIYFEKYLIALLVSLVLSILGERGGLPSPPPPDTSNAAPSISRASR